MKDQHERQLVAPESGLEVAPSYDPILKPLDYSDLEVNNARVPEAAPLARGYGDRYGNVCIDKTPVCGRGQRRICGLGVPTFSLLCGTIALIVVSGAVGGGVGGTLAGKSQSTSSSTSTSTASISTASASPLGSSSSPATIAMMATTSTTASTSSSSTSSAVTSGSTGIAAINCTQAFNYTTDAGSQYREYCGVDWPAGVTAEGGKVVDLEPVTVYTFQDCMSACDVYNTGNTKTLCQAVTYNANLTSAVANSQGNCFLKSEQGLDDYSGDLVASAALIGT